MNNIDTRAIDFFTTPCKLANPDSKDLLAEKIGFTVLAILAIIALGIIIPLITCWAIKHHMQKNESASVDEETGPAHSTHTNPGARDVVESPAHIGPLTPGDRVTTTFQQVGTHGCMITNVHPVLHELFAVMKEKGRGTANLLDAGTFEIDLHSRQIIYAVDQDETPPDPAIHKALQKASAVLVDYFSEQLLAERIAAGDDRMIVNLTIATDRATLFDIHQDADGTKVLRQRADQTTGDNARWFDRVDGNRRGDDALLFLIEPTRDGNILPTPFIEFPEGTSLRAKSLRSNLAGRGDLKFEDNYFTAEEVQRLGDRIVFPKMRPNQAWGFRNNKTYHCAPHPTMITEIYREEISKYFFYSDEMGYQLLPKYRSAPFFRMAASTYKHKEV